MPVVAYSVAILSVVLVGPLLALAASKPVAGEIMLVIGPRASLRSAIIGRSGGHLVGPERARFGVFALSDDAEFPQKLQDQGAWFVVDGRRLAAICGVDL